MYETYYGLQERPFDLSPNPRFLCFTPQHREALAHLEYGLAGRPGVTALIGEAGTGKTTLVRKALQAANNGSTIVHLSNPMLTRQEFFECVASGFGLSQAAGQSKFHFLRELERILNKPTGPQLALIVDEAQGAPYELLEEIRLLTNAESTAGRSIAVVLVGQPELGRRLDENRLRQLKQRVVLRCELTPLSLKDTAAYITARVKTAGGEATRLFSRDAVIAIHQYSMGIPRVISVVCDNALVNGFATDQRPVNAATVSEVCKSLSLSAAAISAPTPTPAPPPLRTPEPVPAAMNGEPMFAAVGGRRRFSFF